MADCVKQSVLLFIIHKKINKSKEVTSHAIRTFDNATANLNIE